jgi:hypothetical protein
MLTTTIPQVLFFWSKNCIVAHSQLMKSATGLTSGRSYNNGAFSNPCSPHIHIALTTSHLLVATVYYVAAMVCHAFFLRYPTILSKANVEKIPIVYFHN